jgi:hypothetical protein
MSTHASQLAPLEHAQQRDLRRQANWLLLDHYRFRCAASQALLKRSREHASPALRLILPVLPLIFGRRESRAGHARRQLKRLAWTVRHRSARAAR